MRGSVLQVGEEYRGYYYGLEVSRLENGKRKYEYDDEPRAFRYKTTTISGSAVFTSSKGLETKQQIIGGTILTESQIYRIQTSDTYIDYKNGAKVKILMNGVWRDFIIQKVTYLTLGTHSINANRFGGFESNKVPAVIELR